MNKKTTTIFFAVSCLIVANSANAQIAKKDFDIAGIKFGMLPSEVAVAMKNFGEGHTLGQSTKYSNYGSDALATQQFCLPQKKNEIGACNGEIRVGYTSDAKTVFFVQRIMDTDGSAKQDEVAKGLSAKYGVNLVQDHLYKSFSSAFYVIDASGKKVTPGACAVNVGRELPQTTRADCDLAVYVQVVSSLSQPTLNGKYIVAGTDHALLRASIVAARAANNNAKETERKTLESNAKQPKF